jgi:hypothetical protein
MTPQEREAVYDNEIGPALVALAKRCEDVGMSLVAEVEWDGDQALGGLTVTLAEGSSFAIRLVKLAADVRGNIDSMFIALRKATTVDLSGSLFMRVLDRNL